ncbi:hypothetical protein PSAB6_640021 [Paraburkholderia sabiae]|uniref:hypothetical protein n=1 Tax=Paraburkholderia sabiae TaxID=273251 RepID=UPI001CB37003|nr:hypothetical protein [Paraburkholderia sabiae]CAG9235768.1 hypothetical protein PSAB6_640021 [Paraburkholderia sabiae]
MVSDFQSGRRLCENHMSSESGEKEKQKPAGKKYAAGWVIRDNPRCNEKELQTRKIL